MHLGQMGRGRTKHKKRKVSYEGQLVDLGSKGKKERPKIEVGEQLYER